MTADFDSAAAQYDQTFTNSVIGSKQRDCVYGFLSEILDKKNPEKVLEINCGTGEDAIWLAKQDFKVVATDISERMIQIAKSKAKISNLTFDCVDINALSTHFSNEKFDLIFSNFGGLNCLSEMHFKSFFKNAANLLSENGQLVLVIMPKNTLWEQLYFLSKADFKNIFRRKKTHVITDVDGQKVATYYYNPKETIAFAADDFELKQQNPVGFFLPPSYLESFFKQRPALVSVLATSESKIKSWSFLAKRADHYFIAFQKR